MQQPKLIAIVAIDEGGVIGNKGKLPWHIPDDLKWFKKTTQGHAVLMGRKTWESLGKPLPNRTNMVLSRTLPPQEGVQVVRDVQEIFALAYPEIYIIGGAEIYKLLLSSVDQLLITHVQGHYEGDVSFPSYEHLFERDKILAEFPQGRVVSYKRKNRSQD
ncbi:MAG: dihydrofolate reductase [Verrucomicrobiota bacterium]